MSPEARLRLEAEAETMRERPHLHPETRFMIGAEAGYAEGVEHCAQILRERLKSLPIGFAIDAQGMWQMYKEFINSSSEGETR